MTRSAMPGLVAPDLDLIINRPLDRLATAQEPEALKQSANPLGIALLALSEPV